MLTIFQIQPSEVVTGIIIEIIEVLYLTRFEVLQEAVYRWRTRIHEAEFQYVPTSSNLC